MQTLKSELLTAAILLAAMAPGVHAQGKPGVKNWVPAATRPGLSAKAADAPAVTFVAITPCRLVDTRGNGFTGAYGPPSFAANTTRIIPVPSSSCQVPPDAMAYSLNVTVVPVSALAFLTLWPAGQAQPYVSTLNSFRGAIIANSAIIPGGLGGAISAFATDDTDVILDINGYFTASPVLPSYPFYTVSPCRVVDTRAGQGTTGAFGPPAMAAGTTRDFPLPAGSCAGIPSTVKAYSLNITVVPSGPLPYLTAWASGQPQPGVSTLNSFNGAIISNAAMVPAGADGSVSIYVANSTDVIIDINGYYAP